MKNTTCYITSIIFPNHDHASAFWKFTITTITSAQKHLSTQKCFDSSPPAATIHDAIANNAWHCIGIYDRSQDTDHVRPDHAFFELGAHALLGILRSSPGETSRMFDLQWGYHGLVDAITAFCICIMYSTESCRQALRTITITDAHCHLECLHHSKILLLLPIPHVQVASNPHIEHVFLHDLVSPFQSSFLSSGVSVMAKGHNLGGRRLFKTCFCQLFVYTSSMCKGKQVNSSSSRTNST